MSQQIAVGECSTEEDLGIEWVFASGYDPAGKTLEVAVRERSTVTLKTTLTVGSGLTIVGASVKAKVSKATMSAWARTEYTADLIDKTGGAPKRLVPTRVIFDEPGKLVGGVSGNSFRVTQAENRFVVTATTGETGPVGPATTLTIGAVTDVAPGSSPTANLTGPAGAQVLSLGLVRGLPGAGAPTSADILALADRDDLLREIAGAGVPDRPIAILDFVRGAHWIKGVYAGASILAVIAAIAGSGQFRASTGTYFDSDGLMKTAAVNVPRPLYDPLTRVCRGYLREPVRTNMLLNSENMAAWSATRASVVSDASLAPTGLVTADHILADTTSGGHYVSYFLPSLNAASRHSLSVFAFELTSNLAKRYLQLVLSGGSAFTASAFANFDLATGLVTASSAGVVGSAEYCGGGIWRCRITAQTDAAGSTSVSLRMVDNPAIGFNPWTGDGVSGIGVWGAQFEEGSEPSSYIPTTASTVTRAADAMWIGASSWVNRIEGTVFVEFEAAVPPSGNEQAINLGTDTVSDFIRLYRTASTGNCYVRSLSGGVSQVSTTSNMPWPATPAARVAMGWKVNDAAWTWEGTLAGSTSAYAVPLVIPTLNIANSNAINPVTIRRILIYPRRLSNAKLLALTNQSLWS